MIGPLAPVLASFFIFTFLGLVEPSAIDLGWEVPKQCPDAAQMRAELRRHLGEDAAGLRVDATIEHRADGLFELRLELSGPQDRFVRTLESPSCRTLADAVTVIVAASLAPPLDEDGQTTPLREDTKMLTGADAPTGRLVPELPEAPPEDVATTDQVGTASSSGDARATRRSPAPSRDGGQRSGRLRLEGTAGAGLLPSLDAGVRARLGLHLAHARFDVSGAYWFADDINLEREPDTLDVSATVRAWAVGLRGCGVVPIRLAWLELPICLGVEGGALQGRSGGDDLVAARARTQPFVSGVVGSELVFLVHRNIGLTVGADMDIRFVAAGFSIRGLDDTYRPRWVGGRGRAGVEIRFP